MVDKISRARKKELEQPDPFLEFLQKATDYVQKHKMQFACGVLAVVAVAAIVSGTAYTLKGSEDKAGKLLAQALSVYDAGDAVKGLEKVEKQMEELIDEYPNTAAGRMGRVRYGSFCYDGGQFQKAYDLYKKALADFKKDHVTRNLILSSLAHTCQALKKNEEALGCYEQILDGESTFLKDEALYNLGLLQITQGQEQAGREFFQKLVADYRDSAYHPMAQNLLAN